MSKPEGDFAKLLKRLAAGDHLSEADAAEAFGAMMAGAVSEMRMAAFLTALAVRGPSVAEITGAARAMREAMTVVEAPANAIDVCGTGGDNAGTLNVSTAAAFVVAGSGVPVAKHGNRSASGRPGGSSIDVLESLGVHADLPVEAAARVLAEVGIGVFFARRAHPAMRIVAPVREELGIRTLMNCLGPLLNPCGVRRQLVGVYAAELVEPLARALHGLGAERALVVHGEDGLDEITTTAPTRAAWLEEGRVRALRIDAAELGLPRVRPEALRGGDARENAAIARAVLGGERGPRRDLVLVNAAAALWVAGAANDLREGLALAAQSLDSGAARERLAALVRATTAAAAEARA